MKKIVTIIIVISLSFVLISCSSIKSEISEEQAKSIVIEHHTKQIKEEEKPKPMQENYPINVILFSN